MIYSFNHFTRTDDDEDDSENDEDDIDVTMMEVGLSQRTSLASLGANIDPLTQRYIHQLLFGCARQICDNPFCANNPNFALTGTPEVAQIAQTLARMGQSSLCPDVVLGTGERDGDDDGAGVHTPTRGGISEFARNASEPVPPLSLELVRTELAAARESGSYVKLMQLLYSNFASVEKLATCFQRIVTPPEGTIQTAALPPARLNTDEMNEFYSTVIECPTSVMNCIVTATATLLDKFKLGSSQVQSNEPSTLDALVILFSNPIIMDSTYHASLLTRMTDLLAGLGAPVKEAFAQRWAESYMQVPFANMAKALTEQAERKKQLTEELSRLVAVLQHLITMRIYTITTRHAGEPPVLNKDLVVVDATRCLAVFCMRVRKSKVYFC